MVADTNLQFKHERTLSLAGDALRDLDPHLDNDAMQIGKVIRTLRQEQGLTLEELALRIGSDAGNLSRVERGKQRYTPELLQAIADALNTPVSHLFIRAEQKLAPYQAGGKKPEAKAAADSGFFPALRRAAANLDTEQQNLVLEFARMLSRQGRNTKPGGGDLG